MVPFSNGQALAMAIAVVPTIQNPDFFVWISNGWAYGFQIPFKIQTIWNPSSFLTIQNPE